MTKAEILWVRFLQERGCVICGSPPDVHHVLTAGMRTSHLETISLCPVHHRSGMNNEAAVSRHPWKRAFEKRYGTEAELLAKLKAEYVAKSSDGPAKVARANDAPIRKEAK